MTERKAPKKAAAVTPQLSAVALRSDVQALPISAGLYLFAVKSATPSLVAETGNLLFPALHVSPGPGCPENAVEFVGSPNSIGTWLYKTDDKLVVKVEEPGATLILSSVRAEGTQKLDVVVERLNGKAAAEAQSTARRAFEAHTASSSSHSEGKNAASSGLKLQLILHIRNYGDLRFDGSGWGGLLTENLWIEALSIDILETLTSQDIEYKGLSANGFESPWLSNGAACGTKGRGTPLIGLAIRLRADAASRYDCEYSGYFQSGVTVGPIRNGTPCRSKAAGDPLVGIQVRIVQRTAASKPTVQPVSSVSTATQKGPKFSKFRETKSASADTSARQRKK
jgi:hypothetical protein